MILQHQLAVLEKKFESEKQLSIDLNTELQSSNQTCTDFQDANRKLSLKLASVESQLKDVQDELIFQERMLSESQTTLAKNRLELEALPTLKETNRNLKAKLKDFASIQFEFQQQTKVGSTIHVTLIVCFFHVCAIFSLTESA